jgi:hypothetical protein
MSTILGNRAPAKPSQRCEKLKNATPGPFTLAETPIEGRIIQVDAEGFGIVEFSHNIGEAQLGFFTPKTELINEQSREKITVGTAVHGVVKAVHINIPEKAGPLALPLKKLELIP